MGQTIAVVSGKGGTGKTSFTANTGMALAQLGHPTLCLDCDVGLRNLDIALAMTDRAVMDFTDVLNGYCSLADAVVLVCTAPKSNSAYNGINAAMADVKAGKTGDIPAYLKDRHYSGAKKLGRGLTYQYPHPYPGHYYPQQYLPDEIRDRVYYQFQDNKTEQAAAAYRKQILGLWEEKGKK